MATRRRFGEILADAGVISEAMLHQALARQKGTGKRLGTVLEEMGVISEREIAAGLARQFGFKTVRNLAPRAFPPEVLQLITGERALKELIFPVKLEEKQLYLAMVNPLDMEAIDSLAFQTGLRITPCITTPSEIQKAVETHYRKAAPAPAKPVWSLLVVEEGEQMRDATIAALEKEGFRVRGASNGAEGLKAATQHRPHLVLADTLMPRMDGFEMFAALQKAEATRSIPLIGLSALASPEEEARTLEVGFVDFLARPVHPLRLVARVKRALRLVYGGGGPPARG